MQLDKIASFYHAAKIKFLVQMHDVHNHHSYLARVDQHADEVKVLGKVCVNEHCEDMGCA